MNKRVLCVWFPNWPIQRLHSARSEPERTAIVLHTATGRRGPEVVTCCEHAAGRGVRPGMTVSEARALLGTGSSDGSVRFEPHNPWSDTEALRRQAFWCRQFTPAFGIEEGETPESLLLDISGCGHLFDGERRLAEQVVQSLSARGYRVRAAIAGTIGTAWAVAHFAPRSSRPPDPERLTNPIIVPHGDNEPALAPLPVASLRLPDSVVETLYELGVRTVKQLRALPRAELPSRFGTVILNRLDQALGHTPETFVPERAPEPVDAEWSSESAVTDQRQLEAVFARLVSQIAEQSARRYEGVQSLQCRLECESGESQRFSVGLIRPADSAEHLHELLRLQLASFVPAGSIIRVHVLAETAGLTIARQTELFDSGGQGDQPRQYERLMDRLSNRLGPDAVVRPQLRRDAQPERAFDFEPAIRGGNIVSLQTGEQSRASGSAREDCGPCFTRPLTLLAEPQSILLTLKTDGGAPKRFTLRGRSHTIAWSRGPERIETGWWRDAAIGRDYFKVQTTTGRQFWIFRRLDRDQWFLHGCFD